MTVRVSPFLATLDAVPIYRSTWLDPVGRQVKLNHNESAQDAPARLKSIALERLAAAPWHRYPDPHASALRSALARALGVTIESIVLGNGGNELIGRLFQSLRRDATILICTPGYYIYGRAAATQGLATIEIPLQPSSDGATPFDIDADAVLERARTCACPVLCLAQPNNPTAALLSEESISRILKGFIGLSGLVVIDEAYVDYSGVSHLETIAERRDVVIMRTLSKAFGLAGVRLGALLAHPETAATIEKLALPYALGLPAQIIGEAALACAEEVRTLAQDTVRERDRLAAALGAVLGAIPEAKVHPSATNFLLVDFGPAAAQVRTSLQADAITVRDLATVPRLESCLRISVGRRDENDRLVAAVRAALR